MKLKYQPLIIIGAPRSGTNLLRDLLTQLPGCGTWPCDEINPIWRHGNRSYPTDEFPASLATRQVSRYIQRAFDRLARRQRLSTVVEKTCANCLRVPFLDRVLPHARYIHLIRDGREAAVSARQQWTAKPVIADVIRQARFVPFSDLPFFAASYLYNRWCRTDSRGKPLPTWGPRHASLMEDLRHGSLLEVCALQWKQCVDAATEAFQGIDPQRVHTVRYEDLIQAPAERLQQIAAFMHVDVSASACQRLVPQVRTTSPGKARTILDTAEFATIEALCEDTLRAYGYQLFCTSAATDPHPQRKDGAARDTKSQRRRAG